MTEISPWGLFSARSLVSLLNLTLPENSKAVEVGVFRAYNLVKILDNVPKISLMYGVDQYLPYSDYTEDPVNHVTAEKIAKVHEAAYLQIAVSGHKDRIKMLEMSSLLAANSFEDSSLDFIFLDSYMDENSIEEDLNAWYPKLKSGGVFSGHDFIEGEIVELGIDKFIKDNRISNPVSKFDGCWCFIK